MMNRRFRSVRAVAAGLAVMWAAGAWSRAEDLPRAAFTRDVEMDAKAGHVKLVWRGDGEALEYELQQASDADFTEPVQVYRGGDEASFRSGLTDGHYFFRVRARQAQTETWGPWSEPLAFVCEHHALRLALLLVVSGGVMFLLIVVFVAAGVRTLGQSGRKDA
jgi:hypothetical protein